MRDLKADLELCEAATKDDWEEIVDIIKTSFEECEYEHCYLKYKPIHGRFVATAREAWPEAIRRAIAAEERVKELEQQIRDLERDVAVVLRRRGYIVEQSRGEAEP